VSLAVHDITGRVVRQLCASRVKRGAYSVTWDGADVRGRSLANGIYFCRFTAGDYRATEKLVLQK
jgi:flagellar hook assembly protein FlgD